MGQDLGAWLDPRIGWQIDENTAYGLNPLNITGEADPDRPAFSRPGGIADYEGDTSLKDARRAKEEQKRKEKEEIRKIKQAEEEARKQARKALLPRRGVVGKQQTISAGLLTEEADIKRKTLLGG